MEPLTILGGIVVARIVGKALNFLGEIIMPYEGSKAYKQVEHNASKQKELEQIRESYQTKIESDRIQSQERIAIFNRQSNMILAEKNAYSNLRHTLVKDAISNFPLNISPLVLLENNNIDIAFLLGKSFCPETEPQNLYAIFEGIGEAKPVNVFITPMHIDARVSGKGEIASQVFDSVYSSLESIFVNEYNRSGERPVIFYSAAWKNNVKGGLHAADELYYFLKGMPTIVVEPRFDGKTVKLMFSCWSIGYSPQHRSMQELQIPLDLNSMIAVSAFERSKKALKSLENVKNGRKLLEQRDMLEYNVTVFTELGLEHRIKKRLKEIQETGKSTELDELGDYSKLLNINQTDITGIADTISATTGMLIAALSDVHHLLANDVAPHFPHIYTKYFNDFVNSELLNEFGGIYERTYIKLKEDHPEQEYLRLVQREEVKRLLGLCKTDKDAIRDSLIQKCTALRAGGSAVNWSLETLLNYYIENLDDDELYIRSMIPFMTKEQKQNLSFKLYSKS